MQRIHADTVEKKHLETYPELDRSRIIINDEWFLLPTEDMLREVVARNSVKNLKMSGRRQCEEMALTLLANIRNDPQLEALEHNLCIGMAGGFIKAGLSRGTHMRLSAIIEGLILVHVEPQSDLVQNADPDKFSIFNLWM